MEPFTIDTILNQKKKNIIAAEDPHIPQPRKIFLNSMRYRSEVIQILGNLVNVHNNHDQLQQFTNLCDKKNMSEILQVNTLWHSQG